MSSLPALESSKLLGGNLAGSDVPLPVDTEVVTRVDHVVDAVEEHWDTVLKQKVRASKGSKDRDGTIVIIIIEAQCAGSILSKGRVLERVVPRDEVGCSVAEGAHCDQRLVW